MGLTIRMVLYAISMLLAGYGLADFSAETGILRIDINEVAAMIAGPLAFAGTFVASRIVKARGGST